MEEFKHKVLSGYYADHPQGVHLLDIDIEGLEILCEETQLENEGLVLDNKKLKEELESK